MNIDDLTFPDARRALTREVIVSALAAGAIQPRQRRSSTIVAIAIGAIAIPAGAATAYYAFSTVEDTSTVRCFSEANLDGNASYLESTDDPDGQPLEFADPVGACGDLWSQGVLRAGVSGGQPPTPGANLPVPELAACVIEYDDREVVAVVPGDVTVCAELGLRRWAQ